MNETNGFTRSLDRKIDAARRRAETERAVVARPPTQGLTDTASTANCNVAAKKPPLGLRLATGPQANNIMREARTREIHDAVARYKDAGYDIPSTWLVELCELQCAIDDEPATDAVLDPSMGSPLMGVAAAMKCLRAAFEADPDYARTWHDNLAMAFKDELDCPNPAESATEVCNRAAARFMRQAFDVDTADREADARATRWSPHIIARLQARKIICTNPDGEVRSIIEGETKPVIDDVDEEYVRAVLYNAGRNAIAIGLRNPS